MRAVIFLICLFALLVKGDRTAYAGVQKDRCACYSMSRYADPVITAGADAGQELVCIVTENFQDEDTVNFLARKYKLLTRYLLAAPITGFHNATKTARPFCRLLSCKYITQRVLRI